MTKNFTLKELCVTKTGIHNEPNVEQKEALRLLAVNILQPARDALGPIKVTSGFRNAKVNAAKAAVAARDVIQTLEQAEMLDKLRASMR